VVVGNTVGIQLNPRATPLFFDGCERIVHPQI
jgi:hypothetical protein